MKKYIFLVIHNGKSITVVAENNESAKKQAQRFWNTRNPFMYVTAIEEA